MDPNYTTVDQVSLVLDLRIPNDRVGSSTDPTLKGHLRYPNNLDQSLNDSTADKIRIYRADYNNNPPSVVSFTPAIVSTIRQSHRETDRFFGGRPPENKRFLFMSWKRNVDCSMSKTR